MPEIIDSLIVTLGLDASNLNENQRKAIDAFKKMQEAARQEAKGVEDAHKRVADSIDRATKSALAFFGVLIGTHSLADFVVGVTTADAAVGRLATNAGLSTRDFQAWQLAIERVGGSAEGATASVQRAAQQLVDFRVNGKGLPQEITRLSAMGGPINITGSTQDYMLSVANAAHVASQKYGAQVVSSLLQGAGFDSGFTNLAMQRGGAGLSGYLGSMPVVSDTTIKRMTDLQNQWATLQQTASQFANTMVSDLEPVMKPFLADFQTWANDLVTIEPTLAGLATDAAKVAESLGGWRIAIEGLVALWAGGKFLGMVGAIRTLLGGGASAAESGGVMGWLGGLATGAVSGAASTAAGAAATVGGVAAAAWLASAGPAGAGEGDIVRSRGGGGSAGNDRIAFLRKIGAANGLDPDKFVALAKGEGLGRFSGDGGSSFGDFQLHVGGINPSMWGAGLGDEFRQQTGLDPSDPKNWQAADTWAAQYIAKNGASKWSAANKLGIADSMWSGSSRLAGAFPTAAGRPGNSSTSNSSSVTIHNMNIHTKATDADGIMSDVQAAIKRAKLARAANGGPA